MGGIRPFRGHAPRKGRFMQKPRKFIAIYPGIQALDDFGNIWHEAFT
jgi:hypothetical protein